MFKTKLVKSLLTLLIVFTVLGIVILYVSRGNIKSLRTYIYYSVCDTPIHYKIEALDANFNLDPETVYKDIKDASDLWNRMYGKDLFIYDPQGSLGISFVYDKKQGLNAQINSLQGTVDKGKTALDIEVKQYEKLTQEFETKLQAFNNEVKSWNDQGGAPPDEYDKLTQRQKDLKAEADSLNAMAARLNVSTRDYNGIVGSLNTTIGQFNDELAQRPEEGVFISGVNKIEIYFVPSKTELIHTLAHELGHSLGIGHIDSNKKAIMYPYTSESIVLTPEDMDALLNICRERSVIDDYKEKLNLILAQYKFGK